MTWHSQSAPTTVLLPTPSCTRYNKHQTTDNDTDESDCELQLESGRSAWEGDWSDCAFKDTHKASHVHGTNSGAWFTRDEVESALDWSPDDTSDLTSFHSPASGPAVDKLDKAAELGQARLV